MRFENVIISIAIGILALVVGIAAIGSFSSEYGVDYTDKFSNLSRIANETYQLTSQNYDATKNTTITDPQDNVVTGAISSVVRFGSYIGIIYELVWTVAGITHIPPIFVTTFLIAILATIAWTAVYLFRGAFPPK